MQTDRQSTVADISREYHVTQSAQPGAARAKRIRGFDGVRGLAATAVVVHHAAIYHTVLGELGVLAFFVLSGYLIIGILHRSRSAVEAERVSLKTAFRDFWRKRILRICPAYYAALFLVIAFEVVILGRNELASAALWYVTYLQNFYISFVHPGWGIFTHTWTLAIEQQFYLLFSPALLLIPAKFHLRAVAIALVCAFVSWALMLRYGVSPVALAILPMYGIIFLAAGGLLVLGGKRLPALFSGLGAFVVAALFIIWRIAKGRADNLLPIDMGPELMTVLTVVAITIVIFYIVRHQEGVVASILEFPVLRFIGTISYGLYIVHYPIAIIGGDYYQALLVELGYAPSTLTRVLFFVLVYSASVAIAAASWYGMERYFISRKFLSVRKEPATSPSAVTHQA